ncbi:WbqC family protein [Zhouia sp. PK063]|uniref:WbqC family protein n=1 Tax=Zhouia sp. PK063 TaxID=3373602 RepID=UPI00378B4736
MPIIHPTYFPSIAHFVVLAKHNNVTFEVNDNYQKQTYRNRMYIYGPSGKQSLTVPMKHTKKDGHQKCKDVLIENNFNWQKQHWKTLETAYRTSPFFEFYEDEFAALFERKFNYLMDLNFESISLLADCLQLEIDLDNVTKAYELALENDYRDLVDFKKGRKPQFEEYTQVFNDKAGYLNNLSTLDLLFNEGTNALTFLENQSV